MESCRRINKIKKYTTSARVSKLKAFIKRKTINLKTLRVDNNNNTLLHLACSTSNPRLSLIRYLVRQGIDPLEVNEFDETALHIACNYYCSNEGARDKDQLLGSSNMDVIRKLIKACPSSMDCQNLFEVTPRDMLNKYKKQLYTKHKNIRDNKGNNFENEKQDEKESKPNPENFIYVSDISSSSNEMEEEERWNERLFKESMDDCVEDNHWGSNWNEDDEECSETYDDWANRMSEERVRKQKSFCGSSYLPNHHSKLPKAKSNTSSTSIPQISEAKRREFDRKMAESALKLRAAIEARRHVKQFSARAEYESNWDKLLSSKSESTLQYCDIPWPHLDNSGVNDVAEFLFLGMAPDSDEYRSYLRRQRVRWHPDRFCQRCAGRLEQGADKERIMYKVTEISKVLNALCKGD